MRRRTTESRPVYLLTERVGDADLPLEAYESEEQAEVAARHFAFGITVHPILLHPAEPAPEEQD